MQDSTAKKRDLLKLHIAADLITKNFPEIFHVQNLCFVQNLSRIYISYIFRTFSVQKFRTVSVLKKLKKFIRIPDIFHIEKNRKKKIPTYSGYSPDIQIIRKNPDGRFDHFLGQKIDIFRTFLDIPEHFW